MSEKPGKSRRRFLADLLFLGGGITAASLLAKSTLLNDQTPNPDPTPTPPQVIQHEEPMADGNFVMPENELKTEECPPQIGGKVKQPEPTPAGAVPSHRPLKSQSHTPSDG
jgi:hypothetical protein